MSLDQYPESLKKVLQEQKNQIEKLLSRSAGARMIKEGIRTVIVGKPNAGKSSLMNLLTGQEKAIVTEIAGTTRDTLDEYITLNDITLHLIDTAGIRETSDVVEKIGVKKAIAAADDADLTLFVVDSSTELDENDMYILNLLKDKKVIILYNKIDIESKVKISDVEKITEFPVIPVSMKENTGLEQVEDKIREMFYLGTISMNDELYITNLRQIGALKEAQSSIQLVEEGIDQGMPEDLLSIDLRDACDSLGLITGENIGEDLANEIFSRFCMGK